MALLVAGYFTYGRLVERIVGPDDRKTPAVRNPDGVDYVELPKWKNMLIDRTYVPEHPVFWWSAGAIFAYYIVSTLFPVDTIIGRIYPVFGAVLLIGSAAMLVMLVWNAVLDPSVLREGEAFLRYKAETFDAARPWRSSSRPILCGGRSLERSYRWAARTATSISHFSRTIRTSSPMQVFSMSE